MRGRGGTRVKPQAYATPSEVFGDLEYEVEEMAKARDRGEWEKVMQLVLAMEKDLSYIKKELEREGIRARPQLQSGKRYKFYLTEGREYEGEFRSVMPDGKYWVTGDILDQWFEPDEIVRVEEI